VLTLRRYKRGLEIAVSEGAVKFGTKFQLQVQVSFVLSQLSRLRDGQTDRQTDTHFVYDCMAPA